MSSLSPIVLREFIGLHVRVVNASCPEYIGIEGDVIDETKNLLVVETPEGIKKLPKPDIVVEFQLPSGERICVDGAEITVRPEERTKKLWRKVHARSGRRRSGH